MKVQMFNSLGCLIGTWDYQDWVRDLMAGNCQVCPGDTFKFSDSD